jgi:hypothetical protein
MVDAPLMWRVLQDPRLIAAGRLQLTLMAWNLLHVVAIATGAALDGGLTSPFVALFFVSIVFAALTLSRGRLLVVACWGAGGLVAVGLAGGEAHELGIFIPCMLVVGLLCGSIAGELHRRIRAIQEAQEETIEKLARAVECRDASTGGHIERMAAYAWILAVRLGLPASDCALILRASPLHDVGKIGVPDAILLKPGPLTPEEREVVQFHAQAGHDLLADSGSELLQLGAVIALSHHERWDGGGYPNGLQGQEIPLPARIVAVADVFDALTTERVYRPAMTVADALEIIVAGRGAHFDPRVIDAFVAVLDEISEVSPGRDPWPERPEIAAREDGAVGAEGEAGVEAGADRPVLA